MPNDENYTVSEAGLSEIWNLLRSLDKKIDQHLVDEEQLRPKIGELIELLDRSKGAVTFVKWAAATVTALAAVWVFISSHFTWKG